MRYPFSPEVLDAMPEELAELFRGLELTLLADIANRLKATEQLTASAIQDIRVLRSHGIDFEDIKNAIRKTTGLSERQLDALLDDVVAQNQSYYTELIDIAQVTAPATLVSAAEIDAIRRQTMDTFRNITQSMGFLVDAGRTMLEPAQAYQWALDNAAIQVQSGAISYNQAIANATRQLADSGLKVVDYETGRHDQVDVAVRRAVLTGIGQISQQYNTQSIEYLETDLVQVSAHAGARNTGVGFENHESWQGKIYRWKKYTQQFPNASKGQYEDFEATCGLGNVQGIMGANCRHWFSAFVEGVMEPTYTQEQLDNLKSKRFTFEGKEYDTYTATQKQRAIENSIRHWKRREAAAVNPEDALAAKARIKILNAKYKQFSEAAGLRMQSERTAVYKPKKNSVA